MKQYSKRGTSSGYAVLRVISRVARRLTAAEALLEVVTDHVAALEHEALDRGARLTPLETLSRGRSGRSRRRAA